MAEKAGDRVEAGEPSWRLKPTRSSMEIEAPASGVLLKVLKSEGETVRLRRCRIHRSTGEEIGRTPVLQKRHRSPPQKSQGILRSPRERATGA
jgi:pyruvate/2-oxoglutarate dehydrogenase complex dihydrolipoamide acyltransferase (E2) component